MTVKSPDRSRDGHDGSRLVVFIKFPDEVSHVSRVKLLPELNWGLFNVGAETVDRALVPFACRIGDTTSNFGPFNKVEISLDAFLDCELEIYISIAPSKTNQAQFFCHLFVKLVDAFLCDVPFASTQGTSPGVDGIAPSVGLENSIPGIDQPPEIPALNLHLLHFGHVYPFDLLLVCLLVQPVRTGAGNSFSNRARRGLLDTLFLS